MRLRLSVQRNNLPTSNILWSVPDTNSPQAYTIARLLEDVSQVLPLEAEQWGLEDYTVEVAGFECLHFAPVFQTLKEDDHVSIRPLLHAEVRSRTLCGRLQISSDGRHLLDGIPFGRPSLKQPSRPAVGIPPRKRRRVEHDTVGGANDGEDSSLHSASESPVLQITYDKQENRVQSGLDHASKKVKFANSGLDGSHDSEDEEEDEDEDFAPSDDDAESDASMDSDREAEPLISTTSSDASDISSSSSESESESESDSDSDSDSLSNDSEKESTTATAKTATSGTATASQTIVIPGQGSKTTKRRNLRRAAVARMQKLKKEGKLHQDATLEDLRAYLAGTGNEVTEVDHSTPAKFTTKSEGKRKRLDDDTNGDPPENESAAFEQRRQEMLARLECLTRDEASPREIVDVGTTTESTNSRPDTPPDVISSKPNDVEDRPPKRLRPDIAAIGRILARQTRNPEKRSAKEKQTRTAEATPEPEGAQNPDFWKSRVTLSAFECWEEDHELSAPPFPFKQHWDPASQLMRERSKKSKKKGNRKRSPVREEIQEAEEEEEEEDAIVLDYGDSPNAGRQESDPTAAIESQLQLDVEVAAQSDLPSLPEDPSSLPTLQTDDIQVGAVVAFKLWIIDPKTFTPEITGYKTAVVEREGDSGKGAGVFRLKLAARDVPRQEPKAAEASGKRARNSFGGFQTVPDDEDEQEDASVWEGMFNDLLEPKLVQVAQ